MTAGGIAGFIVLMIVLVNVFGGGDGSGGWFSSATPTPTVTPQPTQTPLPTKTQTPKQTDTPLYTPTPTRTPTNTPTRTPTNTPTRTPTRTPVPDPWVNARHGTVKTVDLGGGVTLEMVYLKNGSFKMGSPPGESGRDDDEGPVHDVTLDGFWMGKYEVTQGQYERIMGTNPSRFKGSNRPVESVSWNDAMDFCRKLSSRTGQTFTLPTEAQWEFACRAGTTGPFAFGRCLSTSDANYDGNYPLDGCSKGSYRQSTWDVGSGRSNAWSLYDMHGNVYEWCLDWYDSDYYSKSPGRNPAGPGSGSFRVFRGGGWYSGAGSCRSANRSWCSPSDAINNLGFRVVRTGS